MTTERITETYPKASMSFEQRLLFFSLECHLDLIKVMFVVLGDLIEFFFQCPNSGFTVNEFEMSTLAVVSTSQMNYSSAGRLVDLARQFQWHLRIV